VAEQDIGSLGPARGPAVPAYCPIGDSLRRVFLWLVLFALLLRKPNRTRQAWTLVLALGAISLILHAAESHINAHVIFYLHRHICTIICELLQSLAVAIAVLLAVSDRITLCNRPLRFLVVFLILFAAGAAAILPNASVVAGASVWVAVVGFVLFVFLIGHAILQALLRWLVSRRRLAWSTGISLLLGASPILAFAVVGSFLNRSLQLQSTIESFRFAVTLSQAILGPYFVLFWFLLLGLLVPLHRQRLAQCFGYEVPTDANSITVQ
jgi:hypothetical protein